MTPKVVIVMMNLANETNTTIMIVARGGDQGAV